MTTKKSKENVGDPDVPQPLVSLTSTVTSNTVRTGGQGITAKFIMDGLQAFHVWSPNSDQAEWTFLALTILLAFVQNMVEKGFGRKLVGVLET